LFGILLVMQLIRKYKLFSFNAYYFCYIFTLPRIANTPEIPAPVAVTLEY
jgi:hypothetical protein